MRVAIDARSAAGPEKTGVGHYTWQLLRHLPRVDPAWTYVAWYLHVRGALGLSSERRLFRSLAAPNLVEARMPFPTRWFEPLSMRFDVPRVEWLVRFDVLFAPNFVPPPTRARHLVVTVHDLAFERFPDSSPLATRRWRARLRATLARASRVIAVSEHTRRDLLELTPLPPDRVTVVPLGVDTEVFRPIPQQDVEAVRDRFGIEAPYVLSLSGIERRKNLPRIVRAYAALPDGVRPGLVIAGPATVEGRSLLRRLVGEVPASIREGIVVTGYVGDAERVALLNGAEALVYPSRYEGFGLPVLEAMACGTPVVTSDVSALPETAGEAALLVDPERDDAIVDGMERILTDRSLRERLRAAGTARAAAFPWERTARETADALRLAIE